MHVKVYRVIIIKTQDLIFFLFVICRRKTKATFVTEYYSIFGDDFQTEAPRFDSSLATLRFSNRGTA